MGEGGRHGGGWGGMGSMGAWFSYIHSHIYSHISKIVTFINIVITGVKNGSPDMIPVAFERKFAEKKDEIPPGIYRPHIFEIYQY